MPRDIMTDLGQARCHDQVARRRQESGTNSIRCWLFSGSRNSDGYGQIYLKTNAALAIARTGRASQTAFLMHHVSFVARHGQNVPQGTQVSHQCDQRNCFNPDHQVAEIPQQNNSRKGCAGPAYCPHHGHEIINLCQQRPRCIRPPNESATCCLHIRQSK